MALSNLTGAPGNIAGTPNAVGTNASNNMRGGAPGIQGQTNQFIYNPNDFA